MIDSLSNIIQRHIARCFEDMMITKFDETMFQLKKTIAEEFEKAESDINLYEQKIKAELYKKAQDLTVELLRAEGANGISVQVKI